MLAKEIIYSYIIDAYVYRKKVSALGMYDWRECIKNSNFHFYYDLAFNAIMELKCFAQMFEGITVTFFLLVNKRLVDNVFQQPQWSIIIHDVTCRVVATPVIADCIIKNQSFSQSGCLLKQEDGD